MAKFFITTPIYYVNDVPHIGSAYTTLVADVLARAHRQFGEAVYFLTGTDEHGAKIAHQAEMAGAKPQAYADKIATEFSKTWASLGIKPDHFGRTTDKRHQYLVGQVMQVLYDKELIYPGTYQGWYCVACEEYKDIPAGSKPPTDDERSEVTRRRPHPICDIHHQPLEFIEEKIYYFALSRYQDQLIKLIEKDQLKIEPVERKNEVLAFLTGEPLRDLPVTRSKVSWGIPVPFAKDQTVYVWFDALLNYLTFSGANVDLAAVKGQQTWWPASLQLLGKDILRFHAVIWPAVLLALDLPLPKQLLVHGFFTINGAKMSKTTGNIIKPQAMIDRYGAEATRFLILQAIPLGADGDISWKKLDITYTAYLANGLGNLLQRSIVLINKFGIKPQTRAVSIAGLKKAYLAHDLTGAIQQIIQMIDETNRYLATEQPWAMTSAAKSRGEGLMTNDALRETVLVKTVEALLGIAQALNPLMPQTATAIHQQLKSLRPEPLFKRLAN